MRNLLLPICTAALLITACKTDVRKDVKAYAVEQLYNNSRISGAAFNKDESGLLVNSISTGIDNLYELSIADSSMHPLTHSTKESFYAIDYLPGTDKYL